MRQDYFTTAELCYLLRIDERKLNKAIHSPHNLPCCVVGGVRIIPKARFFEWYKKADREGMLCEIFCTPKLNCDEVYAARDEWLQEHYSISKGVAHHGQP